DPAIDQKLLEAHVHPRRRADRTALDHRPIALLTGQIRPHDEEPVHALPLRAEQLDTVPFRKRRQRRMRRTAYEIDVSIAQHLVAAIDRKDQLQLDVEAFVGKTAKLDRSAGREITVRYQVGNSDLHLTHPSTGSSRME